MRKILSVFIVLFAISCTPVIEEVTEESHTDGTPKVVRKYQSEKKEKKLVFETNYYTNGRVQVEGGYQDGERHGKWTYWYDNGLKWSEGFYIHGIEDSLKTVWHENGLKYYEGMMKEGERKGTWRFWDKTGALVKEIDY